MEFAAAREYLAKRLNMPTDMSSRVIATEIPAQVRAHCFFSARVAEGHVLDRLRDVSDAYGRGDIDLATAREKFKRWYDREKPGKRFEDGETLGNIASTMRLDLVMRQNASMAAAVGRYQVSRDPDIEERWPCWRYITGPNPRPSHAELDGKVFLKSDPIWHRIYPPWDFNCNCDVEDAELPERGPDKVRDGDVAKPETGFAFDPAEAFSEVDISLFDVGSDREKVHEQLVEFCAKNDANTIIVAKNTPDGPQFAGVSELSPARKDEIKAQIDAWKAKISRDAQGRLDASGMEEESVSLGPMLEVHRQALGIGYDESHINLQMPGNRDFGVKHWLNNHEDTFDAETAIQLFEKTIWNPDAMVHEEILGSKRRLAFMYSLDDMNAQTVLFEHKITQQGIKWELVDAWKPPAQYMESQKKRQALHRN